MKYFVDVTLFIPKYRRIFYFYGHVHTYDRCLVITRKAPQINITTRNDNLNA